MEGNVILASYEYHFVKVHENLMGHPSNYLSIATAVKTRVFFCTLLFFVQFFMSKLTEQNILIIPIMYSMKYF